LFRDTAVAYSGADVLKANSCAFSVMPHFSCYFSSVICFFG